MTWASWMLLLCALTLGLLCRFSSANTDPCETDEFTLDPDDQFGSEGEMVSFHCEFSGVQHGRFFVWEFFPLTGRRLTVSGSSSIPHFEINGSNGDLMITSLESNHSGSYACRASGCTSLFSRNATLTVRGTPTISVAANTYTANATGQVEITGQVLGYPLATVKLHILANGETVPINDPRVNTSQPSDENPNYRIIFSDLTTSDHGNYRVQAENTEGGRLSDIVSLTVIGPDLPVLTVNPSPFVIRRLSTNVRVTCSVDASANGPDADLTMLWTDEDNTVHEQRSEQRELVLDLGTFEEAEEGEYICRASNIRGSSTVSVQVYAPISLESLPTVEHLGESGVRVSWSRPTPPPNVPIYEYVVYIKQDGSLIRSQRTPRTNFTFLIDRLQAGTYDVSVAVVLGDAESATDGGEGDQRTAAEQITVTAPPPPPPSTSSSSLIPTPSPSLSSSPLSSSSSSSSFSSSSLSTPTSASPTISGTSPTSVDATEPESSSVSLVVIVAAVVGGVVILILMGIAVALFFLCYYYPHKRKLSSQQQSWSKEERLDETDQTLGNSYEPLTLTIPTHSELPPSPTSPNNLMVQYFNMDIDPKWEFPRENLQLSEVLCESQYSILYKGTAKGIKDKPLEVAIKALRDDASEEDVKILFYEMDQLASIGPHPNIVSLLRCCTVGKPLYMVTEYMCHGDLLGFLRASRGHYSMYTVSPGFRNQQPPNLQLSSRDLLSIGSKVANGMRFLADRKIVHRALCCKNILVGSGMDIKVYNIGGYDLPAEVRDPLIKWMSPEVLAENNFTSHSDVWAFGVTLWELVTVGATPYAEINPDDLFSQLYSGMRMPRPLHCAQEVYDIMNACWDFHPASRPHFATIHDRLDNLAHSKMSMLNLRNYNEMEYSQFDEFPSQATAL